MVRSEKICYNVSSHLYNFLVKTVMLCICYTCQSWINRHFYHGYGILLVLCLPLIHWLITSHRHGISTPKSSRSHSHSQLLLPLGKSGRITWVMSPILILIVIYSRPVLSSCYHQTAHVSKSLWVWILPSVSHCTLSRGGKNETSKLNEL